MQKILIAIVLFGIGILSVGCEKTCEPAISTRIKTFDISINGTKQEKCSIFSDTTYGGSGAAIKIGFRPTIAPESKYPYGVIRIELTNFSANGVIPILPKFPTLDQLLKPYCSVTFVGDPTDPNMYIYTMHEGEVTVNNTNGEFDVTLKNCNGDAALTRPNAPASVSISGTMKASF